MTKHRSKHLSLILKLVAVTFSVGASMLWTSMAFAAQAFRPFVDYEKVRAVFIGTSPRWDITATQKALIENIPADVRIVVYSGDQNTLESTKTSLQASPAFARVQFLFTEAPGEDLWARDVLPYPLIPTVAGTPWSATHAKYFAEVNPTAVIQKILNIKVTENSAQFEPGNLVADKKGNCFTVDVPELGPVPRENLLTDYGCKQIHVLPMFGGIGHSDERMIFLSDTLAATDKPEIEKVLKGLGYQVLLLPFVDTGEFSYTYMNSVIVNDRIFVPQFELSKDKKALEIFAKSGLKVIPVPSRVLTENGSGSIHCITRGYP